MLTYDFQRRYLDIQQDEVFAVWYSVYKRLDYSNGMWRLEVLEYVFSSCAGVPRACPRWSGQSLVPFVLINLGLAVSLITDGNKTLAVI